MERVAIGNGFDRAAEIVKRADQDGTALRHVTAEKFDRWVVPADVVGDGGTASKG